MIAYAASTLLAALIIVGLPAAIYAAGRAAIDLHHRGMARVHRGQSWEPRIPRQRKEAA